MSVPTTVDDLLQLIRKSGMVDDQKLNTYLQRLHAGPGLPPGPRELADALVREGVLTHFQAEQFLLGKWRGFTVGKYKLLERIGIGGMGQVFLCEHMFMKRRVAIKILPPAKAEQPAALGRFYREARAAGSLDHPNIVRTHDIDQDGNLHFIVMEYVDGSNLLEVTKKFGPMDVGRAVWYAYQMALGLEYAFRAGIIHRDVKPGNVLIDRKGTAKLLDMGLARFFKDQNDLLTVKYDDKIVLGTADYVAPEQVANSHAVDVRADIYGLGATLYFLLAGHPVYPTGTVSQKLLWHRTKMPAPIRQVRPEVQEGLAVVVTRMLAKDPGQRYQSPAEAAAVLKPFIPAAVPLPAPEEMPKLCPAVADAPADGAVSHSDTIEMTEEPTNEPVALAAAGGRPGPFAPGSGPWAPLGNPSTAVAHPHARVVAPGRSPFGPAPLPAADEVPLRPAAADAFPDGAIPGPAKSESAGLRLALAAAVAAVAVVSGGLLYWAYAGPPADTPADTAPPR
jgi:serine/threonine protein kinase